MKVQSTSQLRREAFGGVGVFRFAVLCGAVIASAMIGSDASAQSKPFGLFSDAKVAQAGGASVQQIRHGDEAFRVVSAADFTTEAGTEVGGEQGQSVIAQVGCVGGQCGSCGTGCGGTCGGSCGIAPDYGRNYSGACGSGYSPYANMSDPCGPCQPFTYVSFDALYMERDGQTSYTLSPNYAMNGFDLEPGARITIGRVPNCVDGYEVSFTGRLQWDMFGALNVPGGDILTLLRAGGSLVPTDLSAFNDTVVASTQAYEAEYWSVEMNRIAIGWDYAKVLYGFRYSEYDEAYRYTTRNNAGEVGLLTSRTENQMFGIQGGMDLLYPIGRFAFTDFRSRFVAMVNFLDSGAGATNDGTLVFAGSDSRTDFAGMVELGVGIRYQVGQLLALRAGVDVWYLAGIGAASDQFTNVLTPLSARRSQNGDDFLVTGLSLGAEFRF